MVAESVITQDSSRRRASQDSSNTVRGETDKNDGHFAARVDFETATIARRGLRSTGVIEVASRPCTALLAFTQTPTTELSVLPEASKYLIIAMFKEP